MRMMGFQQPMGQLRAAVEQVYLPFGSPKLGAPDQRR